MNDILDKIFMHPAFNEAPPILIDIGASGGINPKWKNIARYSVCIAFDKNIEQDASLKKFYKKIHIFPYLVTDTNETTAPFYSTQSPFCSSLLKPNREALQDWSFQDYFEVRSTTSEKTITLAAILKELNLKGIDCFKTDSQGLDLRLFASLTHEIQQKVLIAEFEPGIIDAYHSEDKLHSLLKFMDQPNFWMSDIKIKGDYRISTQILSQFFNTFERRFRSVFLKKSPGWAEVTYFNSFQNENLGLREFLLGWVLASGEGHHEFALQLVIRARQKFTDSIFDLLKSNSLQAIKWNYFRIPSEIIQRLRGKP